MAREGLITVGVELDTTQADRSLKQLTERTRREFSKATSSLARPLGTITGEASQFQKSLEASNARVLAFGASAGAIYALQGAFRQLIKSTIDVEKQMAEINAVFQLGGQNLKKFSNEIFNIANSYGVAFSDASKAAAEFARQGLTVEETLKRTSAAVALARISGVAMEQSVSSLTSVLNTFIKESLDAEEVVNRLAAVDQSYAVSAGDLAEALSRVSSSATDANVSLNQTIALITSAKQITARTGSVIGNSFKTMFTRLQRPEVLEDLESVGVKVRDAQGKLRPMMEILKNLATAYDSLGSSQKSFISETVGGVYQINVLKAIMRDLGSGMSIVDGAMEAAANSTNFVQKRMEILNETISSQLIRTVNNLNQAFSNIGTSAFGNNLKAGIAGFNALARSVGKLSDTETLKSDNQGERAAANITQGALKGVTNLISGPGLQLVAYTLIKLMARLAKFVRDSVMDLTGVNDKEKQRLAINESVANVLGKQTNLLKGLLSGQIDINAGANFYLETLKSSVNQARELQALYSRIGSVAMPQVSFNTNRRAADGYIPKIEKQEAAKGGYTAGRVVQLPIRNGANSMPIIANTAETIARVVSNGQPYDFINPPKNSEAGKKHRQQSIFQTGIDPYSLRSHSLMAGGFVPNLAPRQIGDGKFGEFFDLGKKFKGMRVGKKAFKNETIHPFNSVEEAVENEFLMAKTLEHIPLNPLFKAPKTIGSLRRSVERRSIGKEVFPGKTMREVLDYVDDPMVEGIFWKMVDYGDRQIMENGIKSVDLNSHNILVNDKLKGFAQKVSGSSNAARLYGSINKNPEKISQIATALARQGSQMGFIDPGLFEFSGASSGFVPNLASKFMGIGAYGAFYDLGKKFGGIPIGKKVFKQKDNPRLTIEDSIKKEYEMAKKLEELNLSPLFHTPKTIGSLSRSIQRRSIGKEVAFGDTANKYPYASNENSLVKILMETAKNQLIDHGVNPVDLFGRNVIINEKLQNIIGKIASSKGTTFSKTLHSLIVDDNKFDGRIKKAMARQGAKMSIIDPGLFEPMGASSGFVPSLFNPIANALARENRATGGRAALSRHPLLATPLNPLGLAAIDSSSQANAGEAIRQHAAMGQNISQIRRAYTGKGFVPNLATDYDSPFSESKSGGMFGASTFSSSLFMAMALTGRETLKDRKPEWIDKSTSSGWLSNFASEGKRATAEIRLLERELIKLRVNLVKGETVTGLGQKFSGVQDIGKLEHVFSEVIKNKENISRPYKEKREEQEARLSKVGRWGAGGASVLGGFATQFAGLASPSSAAGMEEFTAGLTTAGQFLLTFPSQLGKIGAVSIAGGAAASALDVWSRGIHNSRQAFEVANSKQQKLAAQIDSLTVSLNQYDSMIMDSSVSFDAIQKEQRKYRETLAQMRETPEGSDIAKRLAVAPDTKTKMSLLMEDRKRISQQQEALAANEAVKEFGNSRRGLFGIGRRPLGYGNEAEKSKMESIVRGQASTTISNLPETIKKSLMGIAKSNSPEELDRKLIMASMSSKPEEAKAAQNLIAVYKDLEKTIGEEGVGVLKKQTLSQLESERLDNTPEMIKRRQKVTADNAAIQLTMDMAMNQAKTSQRTFVNTGALKAGNVSDIRAFNTQAAYNQVTTFGPNSIQNRQNNAALYRMQYGERSVKTYEAATESRRIAADKDFKIEQIKTETSRGIMDKLTQNFDELIKNPEQYSKAQLQNAGVPMLENQQAALIDSLNKGVEKTIGQGNLNRFVGQNGALNMDKVIESISKNSGGNATIQSQIVRYLQSNNSVDILKSILDSNNKIAGIDAEALTEQEKNTNSLRAAIKELDFKQASNYMGGIKNLLDRNSRRTMERNLVRGVTLMERGRTAEARGFGAATFLQTMKEQNIPIDLSGRNRQSILMRRAWATGEMGLAAVQQQSAARVSGAVGRLTGFGGAASMGINEYGRTAGIRTAGAAMRAAFQPENEQMLKDSTRDIADYSKGFRQELADSSMALQAFADDVTSTKDKWLKDLAASVAVQKEGSRQQKKNADANAGGPGGGRGPRPSVAFNDMSGDTYFDRARQATGQFSAMGAIATVMGGGAVLKGLRGGFRGARGAFGGFKEARSQGQGLLKSMGTSLLGLNRGTEESKMAAQAAEKYIAKTVEERLVAGGVGGSSIGGLGRGRGGGGGGIPSIPEIDPLTGQPTKLTTFTKTQSSANTLPFLTREQLNLKQKDIMGHSLAKQSTREDLFKNYRGTKSYNQILKSNEIANLSQLFEKNFAVGGKLVNQGLVNKDFENLEKLTKAKFSPTIGSYSNIFAKAKGEIDTMPKAGSSVPDYVKRVAQQIKQKENLIPSFSKPDINSGGASLTGAFGPQSSSNKDIPMRVNIEPPKSPLKLAPKYPWSGFGPGEAATAGESTAQSGLKLAPKGVPLGGPMKVTVPVRPETAGTPISNQVNAPSRDVLERRRLGVGDAIRKYYKNFRSFLGAVDISSSSLVENPGAIAAYKNNPVVSFNQTVPERVNEAFEKSKPSFKKPPTKAQIERAAMKNKFSSVLKSSGLGKFGLMSGILALGAGSAFAGEGTAPEQSDSGLSMDSLKNFGLEAGMTTAMMKPGSTWKSAGKWGGGMAAANLGIGYLAENFGGKNADMISAGGSMGITAAMMKAGKIGKGLGVGMIASEGLGLIAGRAGNTSMLGQGAGLGASAASWAGTGAMIGSLIPGVGTAVGGAVGGTLGAVKHFASPGLSEEEFQREKNINQFYGQKMGSKMSGMDVNNRGDVFKKFLGMETFLKNRAGELTGKKESDERYENRLTKLFGGGQFKKAEEKELNQITQQLKSLDAVAKHAAKTGDTQALIDALKEVGDKVAGAKEVSSESKMMAEQKINVDISVKDSGAVSNELQQQLIAPLMEAFGRMQQEINELRTKPAPAKI